MVLGAGDGRAAGGVRRSGRSGTTPSLFFITLLNGLTLSSLYFIVAAGFTLVFGLMRNVNLAHGSLYLLGGYIGYFVAEATGYFVLALAAGFLWRRWSGLAMQVASSASCRGRTCARPW